VTQSQTVPV